MGVDKRYGKGLFYVRCLGARRAAAHDCLFLRPWPPQRVLGRGDLPRRKEKDEMRKVIALSGEPKVGKTEAIRLCFQRLMREIATAWVGVRFAHPKEGVYAVDAEVLVALKIDGKTVVLNSIGDTKKQIQAAVDFANETKADLLVTAIRARSKTAWAPLNAYAEATHAESETIEKVAAKKARTYRGYNDRCAKDLLARILAYCGR